MGKVEKMNFEVTVYCLAYNHEKYIRYTLDGFVNQKTTFPFKVVVHDDASTDSTARIIREYTEKYPDIFFPIFQKENQYSKKKRIAYEFIQPLVEGKYMAICEGDDYWCDPYKLQAQYDYMLANPGCSLVVHNTERINENGERLGVLFNSAKYDYDISTDEIIEAGGGGRFHTSSFFIEKACFYSRPESFFIRGLGDYPLAIWASLCGNVHFLSGIMSLYRENSLGSWSDKNKNINADIMNKEQLILGLKKMDEYTKYKYHHSFKKQIIFKEYQIIKLKGNYYNLLAPRYWNLCIGTIYRKIRGKVNGHK